MIGMILESRGGRGIRSHWEESPKIPLRCNTEGTLFSRYANSAGNHEEGRFLINEGYCGLQPEGPIHGYSFRGDAARSSGYPCRLDKSCNRSGQPWPDGSLTTSRGFLSSTERHEFERRSRSALGIVTCPPHSKQPGRDDGFAAVRAMTEPVTQARLVPA